jgi:purine-nucleoside phosphorylase
MPAQLRPTAPIASDALLVGDPGRALLLAQELLEEPKMSNHARGLWGYSGKTGAGGRLTIQATGMGGPSAAIVLADLADLGVRRVVRIGTCVGLNPEIEPGRLLIVSEARAEGGSAASLGITLGGTVMPDRALTAGLERELGEEADTTKVASLDRIPLAGEPASSGIAAADMQTVAVLARGSSFGIAAAAVLVVTKDSGGDTVSDAELEEASKRAGRVAADILSG